MTMQDPEPNDTGAVAPKVKWGAVGAYLSGVVALSLVNAFTGDDNQLLLAALPDTVEPFLLPVVPAVVSAISGYLARHQWRDSEVAAVRRPPHVV
jgi:hypothetical protein